jgi:hypothetical protein
MLLKTCLFILCLIGLCILLNVFFPYTFLHGIHIGGILFSYAFMVSFLVSVVFWKCVKV